MHTRSRTDRDRRLADRNFKKALLAKNRPRRCSIKSAKSNKSATKKQKQHPVVQHQTNKRHSKFTPNRSPVGRLIASWENMSSTRASTAPAPSQKEGDGVPPTPASSPTKGVTSAPFQGVFQFGSSSMRFNVGVS